VVPFIVLLRKHVGYGHYLPISTQAPLRLAKRGWHIRSAVFRAVLFAEISTTALINFYDRFVAA
jgi:hypothetical protein